MDPFCGSGTIPIEAAMLARNMAPGRHREFAASEWDTISDGLWSEAKIEADDLLEPKFPEMLLATDIDFRVLKIARHNAELAGVGDNIHFEEKAFEDISSSRRFGCMITNPPYGERLSGYRDLEPLYESMPEVLRRLPTWSHYVLTSFDRFERVIQKQADRRRKLYNARIECTYYQFHGPRNLDESPTAVFGELDDKAVEQAELFKRRLAKRAKHLRKWPSKRGVTCFRLYEKDIPEIPLVVDLYEDHLHLSEFERPHDRDLAAHQQWLDLMRTTAADALDLPHTQTFLKRRKQQKGLSQHEQLAKDRYEIEAQENGLKFIVNLSDYVDTGLFLDQRETRKLVLEDSRGKDFLNLFSYTGSFTVYAADGGAASTTSVDLSKRYLQWAERNMKLNGFTGPEHHYISAGIREYITALPESEMFDLAVVDPPTFSNSKSTTADWVIQDDWDSLLKHVLLRMRTGGIIYFSTNYRRFKFDEDKIPAECHEISKQTVPEDYRNRRIHRCWRIVKNY